MKANLRNSLYYEYLEHQDKNQLRKVRLLIWFYRESNPGPISSVPVLKFEMPRQCYIYYLQIYKNHGFLFWDLENNELDTLF